MTFCLSSSSFLSLSNLSSSNFFLSASIFFLISSFLILSSSAFYFAIASSRSFLAFSSANL
jgi:hypothetical protein